MIDYTKAKLLESRGYVLDFSTMVWKIPNHCVEISQSAFEELTNEEFKKLLGIPEEPVENPKDAQGRAKVPLELIPDTALAHVAMAFKEGARKYTPYNWRENPVNVDVYIGAARRHIAQYWNGDTLDNESGNHHLGHAIACLMILLDCEAIGNLKDNRPPKAPVSQLMNKLAEAKTLEERKALLDQIIQDGQDLEGY